MVSYSFSVANFEYFLLILVRIASFVYIAPFFGDNAVPSRLSRKEASAPFTGLCVQGRRCSDGARTECRRGQAGAQAVNIS